MADNVIFYTFGIQDKYLEKTKLIRSTLPPGSYKTSLDTLPPPKMLLLHCKQINKNKYELDGQLSIKSIGLYTCFKLCCKLFLGSFSLFRIRRHTSTPRF